MWDIALSECRELIMQITNEISIIFQDILWQNFDFKTFFDKTFTDNFKIRFYLYSSKPIVLFTEGIHIQGTVI